MPKPIRRMSGFKSRTRAFSSCKPWKDEYPSRLIAWLRVGMQVAQPRNQPARIGLVLVDVHPERPGVADAGDANRSGSLRLGVLGGAVAMRVERDRPGRIRAELRRQRRPEPAQQRDPVLLGPRRAEDIDVGPPRVRKAPPDERVVGHENQ